MTLDTSISSSRLGRMFRGQTAVDFYGRRRFGLGIAVIVMVVSVLSLWTQGLNLGLDFEGGDAWDVPASDTFGVEEAQAVLEANDVSTDGARIQLRSSESSDIVTVQVEELTREKAAEVTVAFAEAAGVEPSEVSFSFTGSTWGREITEKAIRALVVFLAVVALFISVRFEWRMAASGIAAMVYDVVFAVGFYSVFQFEVTPATVIAFLTILGYSLYDTIVVFDRVNENQGRYAAVRMPYEDIVNISMNQVIMRSLLTSLSSILPVISLLLIGSGVLGVVSLQEFALALLVGMFSGVLSSIFIATPLLAWLKRDTSRKTHRPPLLGDALRAAVMGVSLAGRVGERSSARRTEGGAHDGDATTATATTTTDGDRIPVASMVGQPADRLLTHPPRPRKKKRR